MSMPGSLSVGVSSCNQDLIKLRQCLGSVQLASSEGDSIVNDSTEKSEYIHSSDVRYEAFQASSNNNTQSQITTRLCCDTNSTASIGPGTSNSEPQAYLKDHSLEAALVTNEMYQEALEEAVARLEVAQLKNVERQDFVRYELAQGTIEKPVPSSNRSYKTRFKYWQVLCVPYLKDADGFPFPENSDARSKRLNNETSPYISCSLPWTKHEQALLYSAVKSNIKKNYIQPLLQKKELYCSKLTEKDLKMEMERNIKTKIGEIDSELEARKKVSDYVILNLSNQDIDWLQISSKDFDGLRSPESCENMWKNVLHPGIYKGCWTPEEDGKLVEIVKLHENHDWDSIAQELGSKRTAEQCIQRYNGHLNTEMIQKGVWTAEENIILKEVVDELRVGDRIPWGKVSTYLDSRHPALIRNHWERTVNIEIKRGPWSIQEDIMLLIGVRKYGNCFTKIAQLLPGRTYFQCRERYVNSLSLEINFGKWSTAEDHKMVALAKEKGTRWSLISDSLPGRTPNMIRQRYAIIVKAIPDAYERVDLGVSLWPETPSHSSYRSTERRKQAYDHLNSRSKVIKMFAPGKFPSMRHTVKRNKNEPKPKKEIPSSEALVDMVKQFSSDLSDPKHVDFMLDETKGIMNQLDKNVCQVKRGCKRVLDNVIDNTLDSLLLPSIVCKKSGTKKTLALSGKSSLEFDFSRSVLFKALNTPLENEEDFYDNESLPYGSLSSTSSAALKKNKLDFRTDLFTRGIMSTISKHCLGGVYTDEKKETLCGKRILPPMRPNVEAFKLMVMDRKRVADVARLVTDISVIQKVTNSSEEGNNCTRCTNRMNLPKGLDCDLDFSLDDTETTDTLFKQPQKCEECERIAKLRSSYVNFKNRFISLFFWPGQMFLVSPPDASIDPSPDHFFAPRSTVAMRTTAGTNTSDASTPNIVKCGRKRKKSVARPQQNIQMVENNDPPKKKRKPRVMKYKNQVAVRSSSRRKPEQSPAV